MSVTWAITKPVQDTMRMEVTGVVPIDLSTVIAGDYVNVFGSGFSLENRGSYEILSVSIWYQSGTLHQSIDIINPYGIAESATQNYNDDIQFFRPTTETIQSGDRTVSVTSTVDGVLKVVLPVTTAIVNREPDTGSYLHQQEPLSITSVVRQPNGTTSIVFDGTPSDSFAVGDQILVEGVTVSNFEPLTVPASGSNAKISHGTSLTTLSVTTNTSGLKRYSLIAVPDNKAMLFGGIKMSAGNYTANLAGDRFTLTESTVANGSLVDGAKQYSYNWAVTQTAGQENSKSTLLSAGANNGKILVVGGNQISDGNWSTSLTVASPGTQLLDPATGNNANFQAIAPMAGQAQIVLANGAVVCVGGITTPSTVDTTIQQTATTKCFRADPDTNEFGSIGVETFNMFEGRCEPSIVQIGTNGSGVLITGGQRLATSLPVDEDTLAKWGFDEASGSNAADDTSIYNLVGVGTTAAVLGAKVGNGREFTQGAYMSDSASVPQRADAVVALLDQWTVEFWCCSASGTYPGSMVLGSSVGTGTIVAFGGYSSELAADNTLLCISMAADALTWRWENGAGVDVTGTTAAFGSKKVTPSKYNHFAVRKSTTDNINYTVDVFINGFLHETFTSQPNATGGSNGRFYVARNPDGADGYTGVIDDLRISTRARTDNEIKLGFFGGCGGYLRTSASDPTGVKTYIGKLTNSCEVWNGLTTTEKVGSMAMARVFHTATKLPDGRVLVVGGLAYNPTNILDNFRQSNLSDAWFSPAESTNTAEIYDPISKKWESISPALVGRHNHTAIYAPERNGVLILGGESLKIDGPSDDVNVVEFFNLTTMAWEAVPTYLTEGISKAVMLTNGTILATTSDLDGAGALKKTNLLLSFGKSTANGNINGLHTVTSVGSNEIVVQSPTQAYSTNYAPATGGDITNGSRTSNVTTLTMGTHSFQVGDIVWVNTFTGPFTSGRRTVTEVTQTTIKFADSGADQASIAATGKVFKNLSPDATLIQLKANSDTAYGPYLFDPDSGVSISSIRTETDQAIGINTQHSILLLGSVAGFPDSEGWIILGFGTEYQTDPIRYFGHYGAAGLLLDYQYKFTKVIPLGTECALVTRTPLDPQEPTHGLWLTGSETGVVAAQKAVSEIVAGGVSLDFDLVYPGDRGLGGEGNPSEGNGKTSDQHKIWGKD